MDPPSNGMAKNAICAAFAAFSDLQMVTVVNSDIDIYDAEDVERALVTRCDPAKDIVIIPNAFGHELNRWPMEGNVLSKMGFDCTIRFRSLPLIHGVSFADVDISQYGDCLTVL